MKSVSIIQSSGNHIVKICSQDAPYVKLYHWDPYTKCYILRPAINLLFRNNEVKSAYLPE